LGFVLPAAVSLASKAAFSADAAEAATAGRRDRAAARGRGKEGGAVGDVGLPPGRHDGRAATTAQRERRDDISRARLFSARRALASPFNYAFGTPLAATTVSSPARATREERHGGRLAALLGGLDFATGVLRQSRRGREVTSKTRPGALSRRRVAVGSRPQGRSG
jgi:hypothetical protein